MAKDLAQNVFRFAGKNPSLDGICTVEVERQMKQSWWQKLIQWFRPAQSSTPRPKHQAPQLDQQMLKGMVESIFSTRPEEYTCDECFEHVDQFAEMILAGKNAAEAMPLVQDHLDRCSNCREEFKALLDAIKAISD